MVTFCPKQLFATKLIATPPASNRVALHFSNKGINFHSSSWIYTPRPEYGSLYKIIIFPLLSSRYRRIWVIRIQGINKTLIRKHISQSKNRPLDILLLNEAEKNSKRAVCVLSFCRFSFFTACAS